MMVLKWIPRMSSPRWLTMINSLLQLPYTWLYIYSYFFITGSKFSKQPSCFVHRVHLFLTSLHDSLNEKWRKYTKKIFSDFYGWYFFANWTRLQLRSFITSSSLLKNLWWLIDLFSTDKFLQFHEFLEFSSFPRKIWKKPFKKKNSFNSCLFFWKT